MVETHEMPVESMSHTVVHQNLSGVGFGGPQIYERVPKEGEDEVDDVTSVWVTVQRMGSRERRHVTKNGRRTRRRVRKGDG